MIQVHDIDNSSFQPPEIFCCYFHRHKTHMHVCGVNNEGLLLIKLPGLEKEITINLFELIDKGLASSPNGAALP